jgi:gliding motility-associated-like protein
MIKKLLSLFFLLFSLSKLNAQVDTSFWFVAPNISATMGDSPVTLHIQTYSQPATVYVRQPANTVTGINATLTIPSNSIATLNLTPSLTAIESAPVNSVSTKGLYISSTKDISVYYSIGAASNKEMISLKGQRALGVDFYAPIPNSIASAITPTDAGVGFDVVATASGTTIILITPRAACIGRAKNITFSRNLLQGETFSVKDNLSINPSELSGSIISADKPIAVTISGAIQTSTACKSTFADQITTSDNIGKNHVILKGDATTDIAYILATLNSTSLSITNGTVTNWLINSGETYSINVASPMAYIETNVPVYVLHISGYGCKLSGAQLAPAICAGSYTSAFTRLSNDSLNLNIVTRTGFETTFTLTSNSVNVPVPASSFTPVAGSSGSLVAARIFASSLTIPVGSHNVLRNSKDIFGLGVHNGGTGGGSAYVYASEFGVNPFTISNPISSATICSNTQFTLNGVVGGGPITGVWSTDGFGSFLGGNAQLTNNIYVPDPVDTNIVPIKITLTSTGICPNSSHSFSLTVKQGPIITAGSGSIICSNNATVQLNGNVYGATNQGVWNVVAPGNGTFAPSVNIFVPTYTCSNSDTALALLKFVFTSTNNAGCNPERDTVRVIMNKAPIVTASLINPIISCANNSTVFLNGTVSGITSSTGRWTSSGTGVFIPSNLSLICNYIPSPADIASGSIYLKLTSTSNQQCKPVRDSVQVIFTQPSSVNAGVDLNSCKNNPTIVLNAIISGTASNSGIWIGGNGVFTPTNTALTNTYAASAAEVAAGFVLLTFSTTNNGLCLSATDQVKIVFQDKPIANFTTNIVCQNKATVFTDVSINTSASGTSSLISWQWKLGDGTTETITVSTSPAHTFSTSGTYTAQLIISNSFNCYDTIRKSVLIYGIPSVSMNISRACDGSAQLISFKDASSILPPDVIASNGGYYWDFGGPGFSVSDTALIFPSEGIYGITLIVTTGNNCQSTLTQSFSITPKPEAKFRVVNNTALSLGAQIAFIDSSNIAASSWFWDFGNGTTSTIKNPITTYSSNGTYTVSLTISDQFGCLSTDTSLVVIKTIAREIKQLIPNMISPNDDGKNDSWRLDFIDVFFPNAEIEIYSRWGERIFKSIGYSNAWDGSYKGDPLPVGAYFYVIKLNDVDNQVFKGSVTLLK